MIRTVWVVYSPWDIDILSIHHDESDAMVWASKQHNPHAYRVRKATFEE